MRNPPIRTRYAKRTMDHMMRAIVNLSDAVSREGQATGQECVMSYADWMRLGVIRDELIALHRKMQSHTGAASAALTTTTTGEPKS